MTVTAENEIVVRGGGGPLPFSQGILAQSVPTTGIDLQAAFEIARKIARRGIPVIDRSDLDRSVSQIIVHTLECLGLERDAVA